MRFAVGIGVILLRYTTLTASYSPNLLRQAASSQLNGIALAWSPSGEKGAHQGVVVYIPDNGRDPELLEAAIPESELPK